MRRRAPLLAFVLLAAAEPSAFAVKEWYDYYIEATEGHIKAGRYAEGLKSLQEAVRLKPTPGTNEQTYGLQFIDYVPYYFMGLCYLRTGDFNSALRMFNIEEDRGAIKRTRLYKELLKLRAEAETAQKTRIVRLAREEVERLTREGAELARARRYDEALERFAKAQAGATALDQGTQQRVLDLQEKVRVEKRDAEDAARKQKRIDDALAEGRRLADEGRPAEAVVRFDEVLGLDPRNATALDGKRDAQDRVRASETRDSLQASFRQGKALFDAGRFEDALQPLTAAATDPNDNQARDLLAQTQAMVERMRRQRDLRVKLDSLLAEAEQLLAAGKYAASTVKLQEALDLDPQNVRTQERLSLAVRKTGEEMFSLWLPNQPPALFVFEPQGLGGGKPGPVEIEGPTVAVVGLATDDRGIAKIEFSLGGQVVAEQTPTPQAETGEIPRNVRFEREFPLEPGPNEIVVTVVDNSGAAHEETYRITRRLRLYETRAFLPSAFGLALVLVGAGFAVQRLRRRHAVRSRFNPYIAGAPVLSDDMFFGRSKLLARMMNVIHHNSLMITGERRIGKTTFLYHLKKALEADEASEYRFFPVYTDLQGVPEAAFFHAVMGDVIDALELSPETLRALRFRPGEEAYDGRDFSHDLQRVVEELKGRTTKRVKLTLLIDEVDALNEYSERVNQRLRSIFMKTFSEHLVAIMSGVGIKRTWKSEGSPWYNFFDEIELTAFTRDEAESLIRNPVEGYFRYEPEAVESILAWSELKPYVIQKLCIHAVNRMLEEGRTVITEQDVRAVRESVRFDQDDGEAGAAADRPREGVVAD